MNSPNLRDMLATLDDELSLALQRARSTYKHPGLKGSSAEAALRQILYDHMPRHLAVGTGEAIDSFDNRSAQIDVIISNGDQPFRAERDAAGLFFIEGVGAAGRSSRI